MRQMTAIELQRYLAGNDTTPKLLDVREPSEYAICRIDGAELIPMRQIPSQLPKLDQQRETVVICHHGVRSYQVALYMERNGFDDIINLSGGVAAWARDVDASMPTY
jgi:rhodanese-related sulfurtransferase